MKGIMTFTLILIVLMVGFAIGFFILGQTNLDLDGNVRPEVDSFSVTSVKTYSLLLSNYFLDDFLLTRNSIFTCLLFISFTFFVNIVLLNLLIAIMGELFDKIKENAKATFLFAKANLILEFESIMNVTEVKQKSRFPVWLQVLIPTRADDGSEDSWESRIRTLKLAILNSEVKQLHKLKNVENRVSNISNELLLSSEDIKNDVKYDNAELKQGMQNMKGDVSALRKSHASQRAERLLHAARVAGLGGDVKVMKGEMAEIKALLLMLTGNKLPDPETVLRLQQESEDRRLAEDSQVEDAFNDDDLGLNTKVIKKKPNLTEIANKMRISSMALVKSKIRKKRKRGKHKAKGKVSAAVAAIVFSQQSPAPGSIKTEE